MFLNNRREQSIPVRSTIVSRRTKESDSVFLSTNILDLYKKKIGIEKKKNETKSVSHGVLQKKKKGTTHNDIVHIIFLNLTSKVNVDLDPTLGVMFFNSMQERGEPFRSTVVTNDPSKVYLLPPRGVLRNRLKN